MRLPILAFIVAAVGACSTHAPTAAHPPDAAPGHDSAFDAAAAPPAADTSVPSPDRPAIDAPADLGAPDAGPVPDASSVTDARKDRPGPDLNPDDAEVIRCVMSGSGFGYPYGRWTAGSPFGIGEHASHFNHGYTCLGDPAPYPIECVNPKYEPGLAGGPWMQAWRDEGQCAPCSPTTPCREDSGSYTPP
jgi:hypothetical protein